MQSGFPMHPLPPTQPTLHPSTSLGSPSITSNTDLLEAVSKQALVSNDVDELPSISSPEQTISVFDVPSSILTYTTGPLAAALINGHHHSCSNAHFTSNPSSVNIGSPIHERMEIEHDSMFTATASLNKDSVYPTSDSPNDAPPIFRNVLHVAIMYGKSSSMIFYPQNRSIMNCLSWKEQKESRFLLSWIVLRALQICESISRDYIQIYCRRPWQKWTSAFSLL